MTQWLVNSRVHRFAPHYPAFAPRDETSHQEYQRLLDLWEDAANPLDPEEFSVEEEVDAELFTEDAARLSSAIKSFGRENVWFSGGADDAKVEVARNLGTGGVRRIADLVAEGVQRYGLQPQHVLLLEVNSESIANDYPFSPTFVANAGRRIIPCGFHAPEGKTDLYDAVWSLVREGATRVFIKTRAAKKGIWVVEFPPQATFEQVKNYLFEELDWTLIRYEEVADAFIVQDYIPMHYEYRFFVVGHRLITGAGCIDEFTPLNHTAVFDPQVQFLRGPVDMHEHVDTDAHRVHVLPHVVAQLRQFAEGVVAQMAEETPQLQDYTLDVGLDKNGKPFVIERNGFFNSGLYATDPSLVTEALKNDQENR